MRLSMLNPEVQSQILYEHLMDAQHVNSHAYTALLDAKSSFKALYQCLSPLQHTPFFLVAGHLFFRRAQLVQIKPLIAKQSISRRVAYTAHDSFFLLVKFGGIM